jgi:hypothetical protein
MIDNIDLGSINWADGWNKEKFLKEFTVTKKENLTSFAKDISEKDFEISEQSVDSLIIK